MRIALLFALSGWLWALPAAAREAVLVYVPRPDGVAIAEVLGAVAQAVRGGGRELSEGAIENALAAVAARLPAAVRDAGTDAGGDLPADPAAVAIAALRGQPTLDGLRALAREGGLDGVVLVAAGRDASELVLVGQRFDARAGAATPVQAVRVGAGSATVEAAAARLIAVLGASAPTSEVALLAHPWIALPRAAPPSATANAKGGEAKPAPAARATPFYLSAWFWTGLLVLGAGAVVIAGTQSPPPPTGTVHVDGRDFAGR